MRILKLKNNFNWKYITGEILLIFIGISLAIGFNNWNTSLKSTRQIDISITHIKEEIENNLKELKEARKVNQKILQAFSEHKKIYDGKTTDLITSPEHFAILQTKYPGFFRASDTLKLDSNLFHYSGSTSVNLELFELTEIAWETTRLVSITNEFKYECLYELESMYSLQRRVQNEIDKAAFALQKGNIKELMSILGFLVQLDHQLELNYATILKDIENCR